MGSIISQQTNQRTIRKDRFMLEQPKLTVKSCTTGGKPFLPLNIVWLTEINDELVEKAAAGIEEVGGKLGKAKEATSMANELRKINQKWNGIKWNTSINKYSTITVKIVCQHQARHEWVKEICECCVRFYTSETFLYKVISERNRKYGHALSPFCWILQKYLWDSPNQRGIDVFRSANLTDGMIEGYQQHIGDCVRWESFTSTTTNKQITMSSDENTLIRIRIPDNVSLSDTNAVVISSLSMHPNEEEVLLSAGTQLKIKKVEYDSTIDKNIIDLEIMRKTNA